MLKKTFKKPEFGDYRIKYSYIPLGEYEIMAG